jgi:hypothetical protein
VAESRIPQGRPARVSASALGLYLLLSFLFYGLRVLLGGEARYIGPGDDPQIFIWAFAWWPHAILHGENPFVTHAIWAPSGVNLTWTTSVPGLSIAFAPLTLLAGPVVSYNVAMVVLPALAAWSAFLLLCRVAGGTWGPLVGGYLFGFSSMLIAHEQGHAHVAGAFLVPLCALAVWRYLEDDLDRRGLVLRLGPLFAFQLLLSTELTFTLALALCSALLLAYAVAPDRRRRLRSLAAPVAASGAVAVVLTAPFVYYLWRGLHTSAFSPPGAFAGDVANLVIPTHLQLAGFGWTNELYRHFPGYLSEQGMFLGPAIAIVGLYVWRGRGGEGRRFLLIGLGVSLLAAFGTRLHVYGHSLVWLPWSLVAHLPIWDNVLPVRLALYAFLAIATMAALWIAAERNVLLGVALPVVGMVALMPNVGAKELVTPYRIPPFFTDAVYRSCLASGETILPLPISAGGDANLWQTSADFRFRLAGGRVQITPPSPFMHPAGIENISQHEPPAPNQVALYRAFIGAKGVDAVIADPVRARDDLPYLDRIATPLRVGGIVLYRVSPDSPPCRPGA